MIADLIRTDIFKTVFSVLLGMGLVIVIFRPYCKGGDCAIWKAPPPAELKDSVYKIGEKCYNYKERDIECPTTANIVEAFRGEFTCRPSKEPRIVPW
jgi:hypothetical protein